MIHMMTCNLAVLTIAAIYYGYRDTRLARTRRRAELNKRVAYMLWVAAERAA